MRLCTHAAAAIQKIPCIHARNQLPAQLVGLLLRTLRWPTLTLYKRFLQLHHLQAQLLSPHAYTPPVRMLVH
jgi:hypothetical protein